MTNTREGLGFYQNRAEAVLQIRKSFFALSQGATGVPEGLTGTDDDVYDALVDRLEDLFIEGTEQERLRRYGGKEEGM